MCLNLITEAVMTNDEMGFMIALSNWLDDQKPDTDVALYGLSATIAVLLHRKAIQCHRIPLIKCTIRCFMESNNAR